MTRLPPSSTLFPYTTLFRSLEGLTQLLQTIRLVRERLNPRLAVAGIVLTMFDGRTSLALQIRDEVHRDRKSTRLNSSHANISYAVFCLKKKKKQKQQRTCQS